MEVRLSAELAAKVEGAVASGRYRSAEAYVAAAVERLEEREQWREETLEEQRAGLEAAWQEADRGELISVDELRRDMQKMKALWTEAQPSS